VFDTGFDPHYSRISPRNMAYHAKNRFVTDAITKEIKIGTESVTNEEGRTSNVSSIEIHLTKKKSK